MRKVKLSWLSLLIGLILAVTSAFAQGGGDIGIMGPMSGRVTDASGRGVPGATVSVIAVGNCFEWQGVSARTSAFGYYSMNVHYDCSIIVTTTKKAMTFTPDSIVIDIDSNYQNINFTGN